VIGARPARAALIWVVVLAALTVPIAVAAASPLLAWRDPIYIAAGLAGVIALGLLLVQPLLALGALPGLRIRAGRRLHAWVGAALAAAVAVHVGALWLTSPPDVIDALLFRSPTPFSAWGVVAMGAVFAAALLAAFRRRLNLRPKAWRLCHVGVAMVVVVGSVVHAMLIEGTMGTVSKAALCALVLAAAAKAVIELRLFGADPGSAARSGR
jgi:predicted ferric reductase